VTVGQVRCGSTTTATIRRIGGSCHQNEAITVNNAAHKEECIVVWATDVFAIKPIIEQD